MAEEGGQREQLPWASKAEDGGRVPRSQKISEDVPPEIMIFMHLFFLTRLTILHFPTFSK